MRCTLTTDRALTRRKLPSLGRLLLLTSLLVLGLSTFTTAQTLSTNITFPQFNSSFLAGKDIEIQATATTPTGTTVSKVEFFYQAAFAGGYVKIGEDDTAPYSINWPAPLVPVAGRSYQLRTVVTSSTSATALSNPPTGYTGISVYPTDYMSTRNWYVSAAASATNTAGTESLPFNTIQKAADRAAPGDIVYVMAGTYVATSGDIVSIRRTGTAAQPIVFKPYGTDKPVLQLGVSNWQAFNILPAGAYVRIEGFEIIGNNANVTLPQALTQPGSCQNPAGSVLPRFNGNGISLTGRDGGIHRPHHVVIANNLIHDCSGGGVASVQSDYVTIENNTIYNTSWYTIYGSSGISILTAWNYDDNMTTPRFIIRNNRTFRNQLYVPWKNGGANTCAIYDGNGIIIDSNNAPSNPLGTYTGKTLIENNVSYLNGGRGINILKSNKVDLINNTTYQNGQSDGGLKVGIDNEIIIMGSDAIRVYNNIFYGKPGELVNSITTSTNIEHNNNLTFGGTGQPYFIGNQNKTGLNPQFVSAPVAGNYALPDPANLPVGDFQLALTSPGLNAGSAVPGQFASKDILGVDRPQGAGVDIGAYERQGTPVRISQQPVSGSVVCAGATVSVFVGTEGPVSGYQWYKDGVALTEVTSATTASLLLPEVKSAQAGQYMVVVTGFNSLTSTTFSLTVNGIPSAPSLLTQSGQTYPASQSVVTVDLNSGFVNLTISNCAGIINWNGPANSQGTGTAIDVPTNEPGRFVYQAICTTSGCASPPGSATVLVGGRLTVLHRDVDNYADNNSVQPLIEVQNQGLGTLPLSSLTLRYYLTVEGAAALSNLSINYAQLGNQNVKLRYVPLSPVQTGAAGYVEFSFTAGAGNLATNSSTGPIQAYFAKSDYSGLNELDDYSYATIRNQLAGNLRITAYYNSVLIAGIEPGSAAQIRALRALTESKNGPSATQINTYLTVRNEGNVAINYSDLRARYYFTSDGNERLQVEVDEGNVSTQLVALSPAVGGANYYLEIRFLQAGQLAPGASADRVRYRISKPDGGRFDQTNDYSYQEQPAESSANGRVVVYVGAERLWGREPGAAYRIAVAEPGTQLEVTLLGNPVRGEVISVQIKGAGAEALQLQVVNARGRVITSKQVAQPGATEQHELSVAGQGPGVLLLQVSTPTQSRTIRVLKAE